MLLSSLSFHTGCSRDPSCLPTSHPRLTSLHVDAAACLRHYGPSPPAPHPTPVDSPPALALAQIESCPRFVAILRQCSPLVQTSSCPLPAYPSVPQQAARLAGASCARTSGRLAAVVPVARSTCCHMLHAHERCCATNVLAETQRDLFYNASRHTNVVLSCPGSLFHVALTGAWPGTLDGGWARALVTAENSKRGQAPLECGSRRHQRL